MKQCQLSCQTLLEDLINDEYDYKLYMSKVQARMPQYVCFGTWYQFVHYRI